MIKMFLYTAALMVAPAIAASSQDTSDNKSKITLVYDRALPNALGKSTRGVLVEYALGGFSPAHVHAHLAFKETVLTSPYEKLT